MEKIYLPAEISVLVGRRKMVGENIGMSEASVLMCDDLVLKIHPQSAEAENEALAARWAAGKLPVPKIEAYQVENGMVYTLMSRLPGKMLCDDHWMTQPVKLAELLAEALQMLWSVEAADCPNEVSPLEKRLRSARENVEQGRVDVNHVEPETFGPGGFPGPEALLRWLEDNRPTEDRVLTHGDLCLPNVFAEKGHISGFIDLGKMGPADRWQDIALARRSLRHNFAGKYTGNRPYPGYDPALLMDILGLRPDPEKERYYLLLDELF